MPAYTTEAMADDAVSILDDSGSTPCTSTASRSAAWSRSSWRCGTRERVRSLVLGATQPGGRRAVRADDEVSRSSGGARAWAWRTPRGTRSQFNYGPRCRAEHPDRIAADIEWRLEQPFNAQAYRAQLFAAALHNCYGRLDRIRVPTLRRPRGPRPRDPGRERAPDGGAAAGLPADRARGLGPPLSDRGARDRRGDRRFFDECDAAGRVSGALRPPPLIELTSVQVLDELRVADVVREHAATRPDAVAIRHGDRALTYARARRALEPAGAGAAGRRARARRRGSRTSTAARRRWSSCSSRRQDRRRRRAAELAPGGAGADGHRRRRRRSAADRGPGVRRRRRRRRRRRPAAARGRRRRPTTTRRGWRAAEAADPGGRGEAADPVRADVHVGHDGRAQGRPDDAAQPRGGDAERRRPGASTRRP